VLVTSAHRRTKQLELRRHRSEAVHQVQQRDTDGSVQYSYWFGRFVLEVYVCSNYCRVLNVTSLCTSGSRGIAAVLISIPEKKWLFCFTLRLLCPWRKSLLYPLEGWVGPRAWLDVVVKRKILPCRESSAGRLSAAECFPHNTSPNHTRSSFRLIPRRMIKLT
jgi:hypothetical protein